MRPLFLDIDMMALLVMALAVWRISSALVKESGPWRVFERIRGRMGIVHYSDGEPAGKPDTFLGSLFDCIWCISLWIAPLVIVIWLYVPGIIFVFTLSAAAIIIEQIVGRLNHGKG